MLQFDWDAANEAHIARRGLTRRQIESVLTGSPVEYGAGYTNGEWRIAFVGPDAAGTILFVVATPRQGAIRVVTAYPARRQMRAFYNAHRQGEIHETKEGS